MPQRWNLRPYGASSGFLLVLAPTILVAAGEIHQGTLRSSLPLQGLVLGSALAALLAGAFLPRRVGFGRMLSLPAVLGAVAVCTPALARDPARALATLVIATGFLAFLFNVDGSLATGGLRRRPLHVRRVHGAALGAVACVFGVNQIGGAATPLSRGAAAAAVGVVVLLTLRWALWVRERRPLRAAATLAVLLLGAALLALFRGGPGAALDVGALFSFSTFALVRGGQQTADRTTNVLDLFLGHLERMFVGTFATMCLFGAFLLALPQSASSGTPIALVDALFTSVSAVCVTGLVVLDTPVDFSTFGQATILLLIQLGGLGIMTFSTAILRAFGRRMSLRHEGEIARMVSAEDRGRLYGAAQRILLLTFGCEAAGAIVLFAVFVSGGEPWGRAAWLGVFTSVSAFCNAGFALDSQSLVPHAGNPLLLHTVALLIVLGGLSPAAVVALPRLAGRSGPPVSAQIRLGLVATGVLLVAGFATILALEWDNALAHLTWPDRVHNAWFQSVTLRTAGFNSIDVAAVRPATLTLMLLWMFVGGNPGGTAGGIKTTTAAVLVASVVQSVRGHWTLDLFHRRISDRTRHKAAVILTLAATVVFGALFAIQITQRLPAGVALFEVVSALGTVGLSIGGTAGLDEIGKIIIIGCMFVGRVGGMSMLMFLGSHREVVDPEHVVEDIDVG